MTTLLCLSIIFKTGVCTGCGIEQKLVNAHFKLCNTCNQARLQEKKGDKPKKGLKRGNKNAPDNMEYYLKMWDIRPHFCEECGKELHQFSPWYISHIFGKNVLPSVRYDIRASAICCDDHHAQWEDKLDGKGRTDMKIWPKYEKIRTELMLEHYEKVRPKKI